MQVILSLGIRTPEVGRKIPWQTIYPTEWTNNTEKK